MTAPIFTRPRFLPASKINGAQIDHAIISDGCIIKHADIHQSIVGIRSIVVAGQPAAPHDHARAATSTKSAWSIAEHEAVGHPAHRHRHATRAIENAIIDKNARIGNDVIITPPGKPEHVDHALYYIRDGIVIIPKNGDRAARDRDLN